MIRKGAQGGSSELLSPERQRQIDQHFMAELEAPRLGFSLRRVLRSSRSLTCRLKTERCTTSVR